MQPCVPPASLWLGLPPNETTTPPHTATHPPCKLYSVVSDNVCCSHRVALLVQKHRHAPRRSDRAALGRFSHKTADDQSSAREISTFGNIGVATLFRSIFGFYTGGCSLAIPSVSSHLRSFQPILALTLIFSPLLDRFQLGKLLPPENCN